MTGKRFNLGSMRNWHLWLGVLLALPIVIVAITTIYLVHKDTFKSKQPLFGMAMGEKSMEKGGKLKGGKLELRAVLPAAEGHYWLGAGNGFYRLSASELRPLTQVGEVRDLQALGQGAVLAAGKQGLWRLSAEGKAEELKSGDWHSLSAVGDKLFASGKLEVLESSDGGSSWTPVKLAELPMRAELRTYLETASGQRWLGGKQGLYRLTEDGTLERVLEEEVFDLLAVEQGLLAAGKKGLWLVASDGALQRLGEEREVRSLSVDAQQLFATAKYQVEFAKLASPSELKPWTMPEPLQQMLASPQKVDKADKGEKEGNKSGEGFRQKVDKADKGEKEGNKSGEGFRLDKVMKSLHTGKFLGSLQWMWGDIVGGSMILFTLTGLVMWWRGRGRRLQQVQANEA
jgi:hypothetical protein